MRFILYLFTFFFSFGVVAQQSKEVDFLTGNVNVFLEANYKKVEGKVTYTFKVLKPTKSIAIDAQKMRIMNVLLDGEKIDITYDDKVLQIVSDFKPAAEHSIEIQYIAAPQKALYFLKDYQGNDQIWTQGQGKYTSNWLPSFDDMNEKVVFDLTINYDADYEVIANGKLISKELVNDSIRRWEYDMQQPMSSYLLALAVGKYGKVVETSESGIPLEMYYYPEDRDKFESTYKHSKQMFDFLEKEIGYAFPWQNYKQIPVKDFLYAGMENTGTTIFSDAFVVDNIAFNDRNYINVNAHELAHQWFGDLVTETEGKHHWLQEGFATYYALLAEKEIFGEEYFQYKLYESAEQLTEQAKAKDATSLLDSKASSLTFYQRGAWALHALKNLIGDANFKITIHNYLDKHKYSNVNTSDFINVAEEVSGQDLTEYRKIWLEAIAFPSQEALDILTTSSFIKKYLGLAGERTQPLAGKWGTLATALDFPINEYLGQEVIYQLDGETSQEAIALFNKAFETNNVFVRQAIANTMSRIPKGLKKQYESLLEDESYATIEPALYHLWANFPSERNSYLDKTKDIIGFNDKNVRILWLVLALSTSDYQPEKHQEFYAELSGYSSSIHHFSTRENAFTYLESLQAFSDQSLIDLVDGALHHNWRFRNFCRKVLDNLLKDPKFQKKYVDLKSNLPKRQQDYLENKLTP
ncbi:M1 family metallopeptidase [Aquimarina sp. 2201CG14-23]|uniref:M1 family metallopeptidase n=1 Tax=Aquimarina mycalae TaxID=3040073 RepID=UPI002477FFC9|nr:M1 family metallopeptidase [Aquimarina sp. 2201CG14-23]MDH7448313.1 M1 family metallopeptidase [Aquimarina sp. 2201CG14-23]